MNMHLKVIYARFMLIYASNFVHILIAREIFISNIDVWLLSWQQLRYYQGMYNLVIMQKHGDIEPNSPD